MEMAFDRTKHLSLFVEELVQGKLVIESDCPRKVQLDDGSLLVRHTRKQCTDLRDRLALSKLQCLF